MHESTVREVRYSVSVMRRQAEGGVDAHLQDLAHDTRVMRAQIDNLEARMELTARETVADEADRLVKTLVVEEARRRNADLDWRAILEELASERGPWGW